MLSPPLPIFVEDRQRLVLGRNQVRLDRVKLFVWAELRLATWGAVVCVTPLLVYHKLFSDAILMELVTTGEQDEAFHLRGLLYLISAFKVETDRHGLISAAQVKCEHARVEDAQPVVLLLLLLPDVLLELDKLVILNQLFHAIIAS